MIVEMKRDGGVRMKSLSRVDNLDKLNCVDFRNSCTDYIDKVFHCHERYIIMKRNKPRAVLMSIEEYDELIEFVRLSEEKRSL